MDEDSKQTMQFADELDKLVARYEQEYDLTFAAIIGVLFSKAHLLVEQAQRQLGDGDED